MFALFAPSVSSLSFNKTLVMDVMVFRNDSGKSWWASGSSSPPAVVVASVVASGDGGRSMARKTVMAAKRKV